MERNAYSANGSHQWNCTTKLGMLDANDDIDGLGVVLGFVIMAWIAVALLIVYYFFVFDPNENPFQMTEEESSQHRPANPVDLLVYKFLTPVRNLIFGEKHDKRQSEEAFYKCILMVADTQLLTGIAIAISGYVALMRGLAAYYWQTLVYLMWFACLTHLSALTCLRSYLHLHQRARAWRLFLMTGLLILLFAGFIPTGHFDFARPDESDKYVDLGDFIQGPDERAYNMSSIPTGKTIYVYTSSPAICYFNGNMQKGNKALFSMVFSHVLLVYGYVIRISKLFKKTSLSLSIRVHGKIQHWHESLLARWEKLLGRIKSPTARVRIAAIFLPLQASLFFLFTMLLDIYCSMLLEIISLIISASWGGIRLHDIRTYGPATEKSYSGNKWGFGQILPLILLAVPVLAILDFLHDYFFPERANPGKGYAKPTNAFPVHHGIQDREQGYSEAETSGAISTESFELQMRHGSLHSPPPTTYNNNDWYNTLNPTEPLVNRLPFATPGTSKQQERLNAIIKRCKGGYPSLFGWSPLLVPFPTTLWLALIFLRGQGTKTISQDPDLVACQMLILFIVWPLCYCQISIQSLFYIDAMKLGKIWNHVVRFLVCCTFTAVPFVCNLLWPAGWSQPWILAGVFGGFHLLVIFYWSAICF